MSGQARYDLTSASPDSSFAGNCQNGPRGYSGPTLDRSTSMRETADSRMFGSGKVTSRGTAPSSDALALSQCLTLEPMFIGDQRYTRPGDLRRVLGFFVGSGAEENSFGGANVKNSHPAAVEDLKRFRTTVADTRVEASGRAKKLDDNLNKLSKYVEAIPTKRKKRLELLTNERSSGSTLKIGSQIHRNTSEMGTQKFEDRHKNIVLNKRVRTSLAETRAESRNNGVVPRASLLMTKERELFNKDNNGDSDMNEETMRRLPASGEVWDKKMNKRKRSVGAVFTRSNDSDNGEIKRTIHNKLITESSLQASESNHGFSSGASSGNKKVDPTSPAACSRAPLKTEQEKSLFSRIPSAGPNKEQALGKRNPKLDNNQDDNLAICSSPIVKGKASRGPRSGSIAANIPRVPETLECWDPPAQSVNKSPLTANNRKRAGPSSPPITQWGGQRPSKISRTRRPNLVTESNDDEAHMLSSGGSIPSLLSKNAANSGNQIFKLKPENATSPLARFSESEESGAVVENRIKEYVAIPIKKNILKEEIGDGVRRQGRSGRVSTFCRGSVSPTREKLVDNMVPIKPMRNASSISEKNGSRSGRPSKKMSERRGFTRVGHLANGGSPDCSGESEDDRQELLEAANLTCKSGLAACSSQFWKTVEPLFASIGQDEKSYLSQQLNLTEETFGISPDGRNEHMNNEIDTDRVDILKQSSDKRHGIVHPLYQLVLSALIVEDEIDEEFEEIGNRRPKSSVKGNTNALFPCNGNTDFDRIFNVQDHHLFDGEYVQSEDEVLVRLSRADFENNCAIRSSDRKYEQMSLQEKLALELQSVGIFLEDIPALDDIEQSTINQEIVQLERKLHEQKGKKSFLDKINMAIVEGNNDVKWEPEQIAIDKLTELAYKKLLATKGSYASKHGIPKVSKQVALSFTKRTLARCHKFEDSGASCFTVSAFRDIINAAPPRFNQTELLDGADAFETSDQGCAKNRPTSIRGKKKEVLLDDVGANSFFRPSTLGISGGTKGKRSERDTSTRNAVPKARRSSVTGYKGDRKTKTKPKQKTAQISNSGDGFLNKLAGNSPVTDLGESAHNTGNRKRDVRCISSGNIPTKESTDLANLPLNEMDGIDGLGVDSQDLNCLFNFEMDGLPEDDCAGLEIPMDDLAELNMF